MFLSGIFNACCNTMREKALFNKYVGDPRLQASGMTSWFDNGLTTRGFTLRPSSPRNVGMRGIGAAHTLYPALQACGMTKCVACGFTLIELLVVVLIIGILTAVALPQYNKSVKKAQATEALTAIDTMDKALSSFYLTHGSYNPRNSYISVTSNELDIQMPVLKYWEYVSQDGTGSTSFVNLGAGAHLSLQKMTLRSIPTGISVSAQWEQGTLAAITCQENTGANGRKCTDYFNCTEVEEIKSVCGAPNCPTYTDKQCYLN